MEQAAKVAESGFQVDRIYARNLASTQETLLKFPASKQMLLKPNGDVYREGEILRLPDLAATYREIARNGIDWFYRGEFAQKVDRWMVANGGVVRKADFASYQTKRREPIRTTYRGYEIVGFPPPSSGGIHVAQVLNILERFDTVSYTHLTLPTTPYV